MRKHFRNHLFLPLLLAACCCMPAFGEEVVHLFNGKDLTHWYTFLRDIGRDKDPNGVFTVEDGIMRISGEDWGCITTTDEYEHYRLVVEFKWGDVTWGNRKEATRDSGVLIHSQGEDGGYSGIWMHSLEVQMIEGGTGDFIVVGDKTDKFSVTCPVAPEMQGSSHVFDPEGEPVTITGGRINWWGRDPGWEDVLGFRGAQDVEHPVGEWNTLDILAEGDTITVHLNGVLVNKAVACTPTRGRIQVQSEGAELFIRKIDLHPLPATEEKTAGIPIIYNADADNFFLYQTPPMTPEHVHAHVDELVEAGVTSLHISTDIGMLKNYPSDVAGMLGDNASEALSAAFAEGVETRPASLERVVQNLRSLVQAGHDPLGLIVDRARDRGLEVVASVRLNEVHAVEQEDSLLFSDFWKEHPHLRIGQAGDPLPQVYLDILGPRVHPVVASWLPGGLDFSHSEVLAYKLEELRELCARYDLDGIELDFQRFPMYFRPGFEAANMATMTHWMRDVRQLTDLTGRQRGHPMQLSARVMATPEQNAAIGLAVISWAREQLVDSLTVSHYLRNDYTLPIDDFRKLIPSNIALNACIEVEPSEARYLDVARRLVQRGPDALMFFNFFTTRERGEEPPFQVIREIAALRPATPVPGQDPPLVLLIVNKHEDTMSFVDPDTLREYARVSTGHDPHEIVITPDQRHAYISNYAAPGDTVTRIDLVAKVHVEQIPTGAYTRIHSAAISPDGKFVYFTAGQTGYAVEISTGTNQVTRGIPTHGEISHMVVVSPDGERLYTANITSKNVSVIDRASGELITQLPCEAGCEGLTFTPDGSRLWVANQNAGSITIIDPERLTVEETLPCPGMPLRIKFTADGTRALVTSWMEAGELVVFDTAARKEIKRIRVGNQPIGIEISPDQRRAFVTNMTSNDVHMVDLELLQVLSVFRTGLGSDGIAWWQPPRG